MQIGETHTVKADQLTQDPPVMAGTSVTVIGKDANYVDLWLMQTASGQQLWLNSDDVS